MNILLHERYRLETVLGIGGQAVVYRATDEQLKVKRAIKVLSPQLLYEERARQRFESGGYQIHGITIKSESELVELGRKLVDYRAEITVDAMKRAAAQN